MSYKKLFILSVIAFCSCSQPTDRALDAIQPTTIVESIDLPAGFYIIEQQPDGYFIRLVSSDRASWSTLLLLAETFAGKFDRIDLYIDGADERGDEYASIIGYQVFDYDNDKIFSLKKNLPK